MQEEVLEEPLVQEEAIHLDSEVQEVVEDEDMEVLMLQVVLTDSEDEQAEVVEQEGITQEQTVVLE